MTLMKILAYVQRNDKPNNSTDKKGKRIRGYTDMLEKLGASHERKKHITCTGDRHWRGGLGLWLGATPAAPPPLMQARNLGGAGAAPEAGGGWGNGEAQARCR